MGRRMTATYAAQTCDNRRGRTVVEHRTASNPSLDSTEEGLAVKATRDCSVLTCAQRSAARGWCNKHYQSWLRWGDPEHQSPTPEERFWARVDQGSKGGCWPWIGCLHSQGKTGYGWTGSQLAHRRAYELVVGPIPAGKQIDHLCRNRICVNPAHLEAVTPRTNILRSDAPSAIAWRTGYCQRGHAFTGSNLYVTPMGHRRCLACVALSKEARQRVTP